MKTTTVNRLAQISFLVLFLFICNDASAQTVTKLQGFYSWLKPIVTWILAIATLFAAGKAIVKTFMKHEQAGMEWTMFVIGLVLWALWGTFATEIIQTMGGGTVTF